MFNQQHNMDTLKVEIKIPETVYQELREVIQSTVRATLDQHTKSILVRPRKITRKETAAKLRVSLPTLLSYEEKGYITGERIGRRVLFSEDAIDRFLSGPSRGRT